MTLTVRRAHVGDIGVVSRLPREQAHARRTADGNGAIVPSVKGAFPPQMLLHERHVIQRVQVQVLVVRDDEHEIRLLRRGALRAPGRRADRRPPHQHQPKENEGGEQHLACGSTAARTMSRPYRFYTGSPPSQRKFHISSSC